MEEKLELSPEILEKIAGGSLTEGDLDEGDILYLNMFMSIYKARGCTMEGYIQQLLSQGCSDVAVAYVRANWDSV